MPRNMKPINEYKLSRVANNPRAQKLNARGRTSKWSWNTIVEECYRLDDYLYFKVLCPQLQESPIGGAVRLIPRCYRLLSVEYYESDYLITWKA